ncbi:Acetyltransferase (GNAT) family protein [Actinopolyspora mzabensis]|uniref:Acetyltransferase (GNAT) family protein n=2 Tax=Actinopolyspora mzabensis TaxID=995066 RepID=A0A1G8WP14_ACTMZ|nr:Acetyltransferase (GNAT) family protein [Actinopolyspora mzabensis]
MRGGWPATRETTVDGWLARLSGGVTRRANSVLPCHAPSDAERTLTRVEELYRGHGLPPVFQLGPAAQPSGLDSVLARRGYELRTPTIVQIATIEDVLHRLPDSEADVRVRRRPDTTWMDLWWEVDGRGGPDSRELSHDILTGVPGLYARSHHRDGIAAVGRLALVDSWVGVYCMAVRPDARRRGHAQAVLRGLLERAAEHGSKHTWLQVTADNHAARTLYERVGFAPAANYHYRELTKPAGETLPTETRAA